VLIFRRWKVALPLLLLTIGGTAFVAFTAKPDYTMTSYVQFIPAKASPADKDNPAGAALRNPWNQLGLNTLGQATIYATQDQQFLDSLKAAKHSDNFTLTMTYPNPIVTVEVVGSTAADARETTALVISRLRDSAEAMQRQSGVQDVDMIATQRLDQGQNLLPSTSKIKRAIFAVAVAGLVLVAGGTVGFDAIARRRSRRREERERQQAESSPEPPTGTTDGAEMPALPKVPVVHAEIGGPSGETAKPSPAAAPPEKPAGRPVSLAGAAPSPSMERTAIVVKRAASVVRHPSTTTSTRPPAATYRSVNARSEAKGEGNDSTPAATNGSAPAQSDVRVVLQPKWVGGENGGKSR
jgi:hypothetical protein